MATKPNFHGDWIVTTGTHHDVDGPLAAAEAFEEWIHSQPTVQVTAPDGTRFDVDLKIGVVFDEYGKEVS